MSIILAILVQILFLATILCAILGIFSIYALPKYILNLKSGNKINWFDLLGFITYPFCTVWCIIEWFLDKPAGLWLHIIAFIAIIHYIIMCILGGIEKHKGIKYGK